MNNQILRIVLSNLFNKIFFMLLSIGYMVPLYAGTINNESSRLSKLNFEENKNQWPKQVAYQVDIPGGALFLEKNMFTYHLVEHINHHELHHEKDVKSSITVRHHAWKVKFINPNPNVQLQGKDSASFVRNYYKGNNPSGWASGVRVFSNVLYKNMYENIDIALYTANTLHLKYDFIVKPGGDYREIKMTYEGIDSLRLMQGNLLLKTNLGEVIEQKPYAYQLIDGKKKEILCSYVLKGKQLCFSVGKEYDSRNELIIDPVLVASTYTGATSDNFGFTSTYDNQGNIYTGGISFGVGYPTSIGAFDSTFNGGSGMDGFDISLTKFNADGSKIIYSTYLGGKGNEQPHSLIVNKNNELFLIGRSESTNFPFTKNAYDTTLNGKFDNIVCKFNATGSLLASTFLGGSADDGVNFSVGASMPYGITKFNYGDDGRSEVVLDTAGNVYITGSTKSSNFPLVHAYDTTLGGQQDGFVCKLNSSLNALLFSTYLGGSKTDASYAIRVDDSGNSYITGGTESIDFPFTKNAYDTTYNGGMTDGFISILNSKGNNLLGSTYLGTSEYDQSYLIDLDLGGNIYVYGQTMGAYPVTAGVYTNSKSSQFVHKFNNALTASIFSTVIGNGTSSPNLSPTGFLVDSCESIYISGWSRDASFYHPNANQAVNMPVTPNAMQASTDGKDFYYMVLKPNAKSLAYATYFGENTGIGGRADHVDGGTSRFDKHFHIYQSVCASCGSTNGFPTTANAYSKTNNSPNCNNAVYKLDLSIKASSIFNITTGFNTSAGVNIGCAPYAAKFNSINSIGSVFEWDFGDGIILKSDSNLSPSHTYTLAGSYTVSLTVHDTLGTCIFSNISKKEIKVSAGTTSTLSSSNNFCFGGKNGSATITTTGGIPSYTYNWSNGSTTTNLIGLSAGIYTVTVTDLATCKETHTISITEPTAMAITASTSGTCQNNGVATIAVTGGTPGYKLLWGDGQTTSSINGLVPGTYSVAVTDTNGCTMSLQNITVNQMPAPLVTVSNNASICLGTSYTLNANSANATHYTWSPSIGLTSTTIANPIANPSVSTHYTVTVTDSYLCTNAAAVMINIIPPPPTILWDTAIVVGQPLTLTAAYQGIGYSYMWSPPDSLSCTTCPFPFIKPGVNKQFIVTTKDSCFTVNSVVRIKILEQYSVDVPTAFSPNGDGTNDVIYVDGWGIKQLLEFKIYNRWGELLFESNDLKVGWDGKYKGEIQNVETYTYTVVAAMYSNTPPITKKGFIKIIK